ncbi:MAG: hypothetical protein E7521_04255 [Ruminococcaceae bacterium]|nr:hypothetical protein [Oscillospiraceae bacterium]
MSGISIVYIAAAVCSLLMLVAYCVFIKKKFAWFWVLFSSICVVNVGYFALSISKTLDEALLANRIAYLGSVFLPISMLLIILNATDLHHPKWLWIPLVCLGAVVFFVAASPGYLDIYYKEVSLITQNGITVLDKVYGPWHIIYLFYLLGYFIAMITAAIQATVKKKIASAAQTVMLLGAVFVNICVWAIEQFVKIEFEFLAVSYIISELFLIGLYVMIQENERRIELARQEALMQQTQENKTNNAYEPQIEKEVLDAFNRGIIELTHTEKLIYDLYVCGKSTKEVLAEMNIKENTLKYHNKNIYGKLGVSSRKELKAIAKYIAD